MAVSEGFQPVKSAGRALDVLEALADSPGRRSLMELARDLGIPKSSLHGILRTLAQRGWVETDETGTRFRLGLRALQVGAAYLAADDVVGLVSGGSTARSAAGCRRTPPPSAKSCCRNATTTKSC